MSPGLKVLSASRDRRNRSGRLLHGLGAPGRRGSGHPAAADTAGHAGLAAWLSFSKLVLHPLAVAFAVLVLIPVEPYVAGVMIAVVAGPLYDYALAAANQLLDVAGYVDAVRSA